jgi:TonB-linked SusC/RagA family outer membrane protein
MAIYALLELNYVNLKQKSMKKILLYGLLLMFTVSFSWAQERTISGKVTSVEDGSTLPGVNVYLKGTTSGGVTDMNGDYRVSVPEEGGTLVFSFIGLESMEVEIGTRSVVDVQMASDITQLGEVVVTAIGIEREKRSIGYGIDNLDGEELTKARATNFVNSLQGKITGVQISNTSGNVGGSSKIIVRGVSSLSGRNNPVFVVDGVFINNSQTVTGSRISGNRDFANGASVLNPDDIETMSVLKGAAATALYGSRAAAGAIIITTKRGQAGAGGKPTISINSTVRVDRLLRIPDYQQQYAMGDLAKYDSSSVGFDWGPRFVGQDVNYLPITGETGPLTVREDNGINDFYETGVTFINNFAISDADERMDYRLSFTALNQDGMLPAARLDRYTFNLNAGVNHSKYLKSRFGVQYINSKTVGTGAAGANDTNIIGLSSFSSTLDQRNYKPWIDDAGNQINQTTPTANNPYWLRNENANDRNDDRFIGNLSLVLTPIEKLNITGRVGYDYEIDDRFFSNRKGTAQNLGGNFTVDKIRRTELTADFIANYDFEINSDFNISVLGGYQYNKRHFDRETLTSQDLLIAQLFAPGNAAQNVNARGFADQVLVGAYGQARFSYKNWLNVDLTGRNDWSSTLPLDNNSYFYPSVSVAWVFTDALNISNNVLSYGKLRASYAEVGNDTGPYQLDFTFNPITTATGQYGLNVNFPFNSAQAFSKVNTIPNSELLPERQKSYEFGAELNFFDGRLTLDVAYFNSQNTNQILALPIPESTGFGFFNTNVGRVDNQGAEIQLDISPVAKNNFTWNTLFNFSLVRQNVVELAENTERVLIASGFNSVQVVAEVGKPFQLFAVPFLRDSVSGRPIVDANEGTRLPGEARSMGSVMPDFTLGWVNSFNIYGFNVGFTIDWRQGGIMKSSTAENLQTGGLVAETVINREGTFIDRGAVVENPDGTFRDNDIPLRSTRDFWLSLDDNSIAEAFLYDASYVKLREVYISYSFTKFKDSFFSNITVGIEGRNLALLYSKVPHIDPESGLFGSGADGFGVERAAVPSTRGLGFNVRLTF